MAYSLYTEIQPATGVDAATKGRFFPESLPTAVHLATGQGNTLRVYDVATASTSQSLSAPGPGTGHVQSAGEFRARAEDAQLELVTELTLNGEIMGLEAVRFPGSSYDALMISLPEAKVTVLQWDASRNDFVTTSMHLFESPELQRSRVQYSPLPKVVVDPENRCAAFPLYNTKLAVMPFADPGQDPASRSGRDKAGEAGVDGDLIPEPPSHLPIRSSFVIDLLEVEPEMRHVVDIVFLHGYFEPTVLILYAPKLNFEGRMSKSFDNCKIAALSLNLQQKSFPIIWHAEGISFNAFQLLAVPSPIGGALVFSNNAILHYHQNAASGIAVNGYAFDNDGEYPFLLGDTGFAFNLKPSCATVLDPRNVVVVNPIGDVYMLHMRPRPAEGTKLTLTKVGACIKASVLVAITPTLYFHGSHVGDALLIAFRVVDQELDQASLTLPPAAQGTEPVSSGTSAPPPSKKQKTLAAEPVVDDDDNNGGVAEMEVATSSKGKEDKDEEEEDEEEEVDEEQRAFMGKIFGPRAGIELPQFEVDEEDVSIFGKEEAEAFVTDTSLGTLKRRGPTAVVTSLPATAKKNKAHDEYEFQICDRVVNVGPAVDSVLARVCEPEFGTPYEAGVGELTDLVVACGYDRAGALGIISTGVRPDVVSTLSFPGVAAWAVQVRDPEAEKQPQFLERTVLVPAPPKEEGSVPAQKSVAEVGQKRSREDDDDDDEDDDKETQPKGKEEEEEEEEKEKEKEEGQGAAPSGSSGTTEELPGVVIAEDGSRMMEQTEYIPVDPSWHRYFVVSREDRTVVLSSQGFSISEVTEEIDYYLEGPTVLVAPLFGGQRTLQVYPGGLRLLENTHNTQEYKTSELIAAARAGSESVLSRLGSGESIVAAVAADPYVVLRLSSDAMIVVRASPDSMLLDVLELPEELLSDSIASVSLFTDSGELTRASPAFVDAAKAMAKSREAAKARQARKQAREVRDDGTTGGEGGAEGEEEGGEGDEGGEGEGRMYGLDVEDVEGDELFAPTGITLDTLFQRTGSTTSTSTPSATTATGAATGATGAAAEESSSSEGGGVLEPSSTYVVLVRKNGTFELRHLPELTLAFAFPHFTQGPVLMMDTSRNALPDMHSEELGVSQVTEVGMVSVKGRVYAIAFLSTNDVFFYEAYRYEDGDLSRAFQDGEASEQLRGKPHVPIRMRKVDHLFMQGESERRYRGASGVEVQRIVALPDLGGVPAVAVVGMNPVLCTFERGMLRTHLMHADGPLRSVTPYHSPLCESGFAYVTEGGQIKFCVLPSGVTFEHRVAVQKVTMDGTPRQVAYVMSSNAIVATVSHKEEKRSHPSPQRNKEHDPPVKPEELPPPPNASMPTVDVFELRLIAPGVWETIDVWSALKPFEHITAMKCLRLRHRDASERTFDFDDRTGGKWAEYIVVGTSILKGEENKVYGRLLVFSVVEVIPQPGRPWTNRKLKLRSVKACKGGVTSLAVVRGIIMSGIEQTMLGYVFNAAKDLLEETTFHDCPMMATDMISVKNYMLYADVMKSIMVMYFRDEDATIHLMSRDYDPLNTTATDFMVDGKDVHFLVADDAKYLRVYSLMKHEVDSRGGRKLLRRTVFHVGAQITRLLRTVFPIPNVYGETVHVNIVSTSTGAIGMLLPIDEMVYKRLVMLQSMLVSAVPQVGGLHPAAFRRPVSCFDGRMNYGRPILDGALLRRWLLVDAAVRAELASKCGTTVEAVWRSLRDIGIGMAGIFS